MKKGVAASFAAWCVAAMVIVLVAEVHETAAATFNPTELSPCLGAITGGGAPSADCCSKLKQQQPCLCSYVKNPALQPYVNSPNARRVASYCGLTIPAC